MWVSAEKALSSVWLWTFEICIMDFLIRIFLSLFFYVFDTNGMMIACANSVFNFLIAHFELKLKKSQLYS